MSINMSIFMLMRMSMCMPIHAGQTSIFGAATTTVEDWHSVYNEYCRDLLKGSETRPAYVPMSASFTDAIGLCHGDSGAECYAPSCARDAPEHCHKDDKVGLLARFLCPETCGCNSPNSSLILNGPRFGCGQPCRSSSTYTDLLAKMPCTDQHAGSSDLLAYAIPLKQTADTWKKLELIAYADQILDQGCPVELIFNVTFQRLYDQRLVFNDTFYNNCASWPCDNVARQIARDGDGTQEWQGIGRWLTGEEAVNDNGVFKLVQQHFCGGEANGLEIGPLGSSVKPLTTLCPVLCGCRIAKSTLAGCTGVCQNTGDWWLQLSKGTVKTSAGGSNDYDYNYSQAPK